MWSLLKVFVYEHLSGGGAANHHPPLSSLSDGFGMLSSLLRNLRKAGYFTTTTLDGRIASLRPPLEADKVAPASTREETVSLVKELAEEADYSYVIAPEAGGTLEELVELTGKLDTSLNCKPREIARAADKLSLLKNAKEIGLEVPETVAVSLGDMEDGRKVAKEMSYPLIVKPSEGVGCSGLSVVTEEEELVAAFRKVDKLSSAKQLLIQRIVRGVPVSISLISTGKRALLLALNSQDILFSTPDSDSEYLGGAMPYHHPLRRRALEAAKRLVESTKLTGYVGVDLVLTRRGPVIMEVNPRLTTSFVGLSMVLQPNIAQLIVDAVVRGKLPDSVEINGCALVSKLLVEGVSQKKLQKAYDMEALVSPPFPIGADYGYALLAVCACRAKEARLRALESEKQLLRLFPSRPLSARTP